MDPRTETAEATLRRHRPRAFLAFFGINRCHACRNRWPCNFWHNARDQRDRVLDIEAIARMTDVIRRTYGEPPSNQGRWS